MMSKPLADWDAVSFDKILLGNHHLAMTPEFKPELLTKHQKLNKLCGTFLKNIHSVV